MADKKISELTELTAPDGAEELVVNDSGTSKKITIDNLIADNGLSGDKIDGGTISNFTSTGIDDNATSTAITIDASENVGVGTSSPLAPIQVSSANGDFNTTYDSFAGVSAFLSNNGSATQNTLGGAIAFDSPDGNGSKHAAISPVITGTDNNQVGLSFYVHPSVARTGALVEAMRIDSSGNVGIGTTSPTSPSGAAGPVLDLQGSNPEIVFHDNGGTANAMSMYYLNDTLRWYSGSSQNMLLNNSGNLTVYGALAKGSGSFKIEHPLEAKKDTHHLVHSFVESPRTDLIYRGKTQLTNGQSTINIDEYFSMTNGTFDALTDDVDTFTSNETGWDSVKGSVTGNILTIDCQSDTCSDTVSWMVVADRKDKHIMETSWTDENGKPILEPLKTESS